MDEPQLRGRLRCAELQLGWIAETLPRFLDAGPAPIGFCVFDVDQYHATADAARGPARAHGPVDAVGALPVR